MCRHWQSGPYVPHQGESTCRSCLHYFLVLDLAVKHDFRRMPCILRGFMLRSVEFVLRKSRDRFFDAADALLDESPPLELLRHCAWR